MKRALILVNAYANIRSMSSQARRLKEEFEARGVCVETRRNGELSLWLGEDGKVHMEDHGYDFCVYLDKDKYTSQMLEGAGLRLFNSHEAVQVCDDKMETFLRLQGKGIPMPKTIPAPLCYDSSIPPNEEFLDRVAAELGLPVVVKESYGSLGGQVYLAKTREELGRIAAAVQGKQHLYQQFVAGSAGCDIRVIVIGGKVAAAMKRVSEVDFRSNIELGGRGEVIDLPEEAAELSEKAAKLLGLDYCGVDVLFGPDGFLLCEVNSNAFFEGLELVTGDNIAAAYVNYILREMDV